MSSKPTRELQVSKSLVESWIEVGLRSIGQLRDANDVVALQVGDMTKDLVNIIYKTKQKELPMEVILHRTEREEEFNLVNGKRKKLSQGVRRLPCETRTKETPSTEK